LKPRLEHHEAHLRGLDLGRLVTRGDMPEQPSAIIERDGDWFIASSPEATGANGQGRTRAECIESLRPAIELILEDRRQREQPFRS
jgi:predicted RNase H-like HicB family nuclease